MKKNIKKYWMIFLIFFVNSSFSFASDFYYTIWKNSSDETTNLWKIIKTDAVQWTTQSKSILERLLDLFQFSEKEYWSSWNTPAIAYIKWIVNMWLGLVSFISLILVIYGFYLMFFSKEEEGYSKAKKILKGVAIALAIMWLSWFIVSFFFYVQTGTSPL